MFLKPHRYNHTFDEFANATEQDLYMFVSFVINATREYGYDGFVEGWEESWTFPKALLFTITIMATIGIEIDYLISYKEGMLLGGAQSASMLSTKVKRSFRSMNLHFCNLLSLTLALLFE